MANTLEELYCENYCGVDQNGIFELKKLRILGCDDNKKIKDVNHLANTLEELDCESGSGIDQKGISELRKLKRLNFLGNKKIINTNHISIINHI